MPEFIRKKVDEDNRIRKRDEYWNENKIYYIVLPEFLQSREMNGCLITKQVHKDEDRICSFSMDAHNRLCISLKKVATLQDFLDSMKELFYLEPDDCMFWKFDLSKEWLVPLFQTKSIKDIRLRKLHALFKETRQSFPPIIVVQTRNQKCVFQQIAPYNAIPDLEKLGIKEDSPMNCYVSRQTSMVDSVEADDMQPPQPISLPDPLFLEVLLGKAVFVLLKVFKDGRFFFKSSFTRDSSVALSSLEFFSLRKVYYVEKSNCEGQTFFEKGRIEIDRITTPDVTLKELALYGTCILVEVDLEPEPAQKPLAQLSVSRRLMPDHVSRTLPISDNPKARATIINDHTHVKVMFSNDDEKTITILASDTFEEVFEYIVKLMDFRKPRDYLKLVTTSLTNPREYDYWYDEPETRTRLFAEVLEVTQAVNVITMPHSYQVLKENALIREIVSNPFRLVRETDSDTLIPKSQTLHNIIQENRDPMIGIKNDMIASLAEIGLSKVFEIG